MVPEAFKRNKLFYVFTWLSHQTLNVFNFSLSEGCERSEIIYATFANFLLLKFEVLSFQENTQKFEEEISLPTQRRTKAIAAAAFD